MISCGVERLPPIVDVVVGVVSRRRRAELVSSVCREWRSTEPPPTTVTLVLTFRTRGAGEAELRARRVRPAVPVWAAVSRADQDPLPPAERVRGGPEGAARPPPARDESPAGSADSHLMRLVLVLAVWVTGERPELGETETDGRQTACR